MAEAAACALTVAEVAAIFGVSKDTIERNYADAMAEGRERASGSIKRAQFKYALAGSAPLLMFLGKNYCNQSDRPEPDVDVSASGPRPRGLLVTFCGGELVDAGTAPPGWRDHKCPNPHHHHGMGYSPE